MLHALPLALSLLSALATLPAGRTIEGTLVLEDIRGNRTTPTTASIAFASVGVGAKTLDAEVREGRFSLELPPDWNDLDIGPILADGRTHWALPSWTRNQLPAQVDIVARPVVPSFVRFVEAETGLDLPFVFLSRPGRDPHEPHSLGDSLVSPGQVPLFGDGGQDAPRGWIGMRDYLVYAPGRGAIHVWIDPSEGGSRTFELAAEARLTVKASTRIHSPSAYSVSLRLRGDQDLDLNVPIALDGLAPAHGLRAGTWTVRLVEVGADRPEEFEPVTIDLRPGDWKQVEVGLISARNSRAARSIERPTPLRGTLRLPRGVDARALTLSFAPLNQAIQKPEDVPGELLVPDPRRERVFHWFAAVVEPGRWSASIASLNWTQPFDLTRDAIIALDADEVSADEDQPAEVLAKFIDGATGRALGPSEIEVAIDAKPWSLASAQDETQWRLTAPIFPIRLRVHRIGESGPDHEFSVESAAGEHAFTLRPRLPIEVRAYDGDARIGAPEILSELCPVVEAVEHAGTAILPAATTARANEYTDLVTQPGRYRISLSSNLRYAPHAPVEIEVKLGEPMPVAVFRLHRADR